MTTAPSGERIHITFFGLRNAGKSTLLNAIAGRTVSIVSDIPGTTTDPVSRPMELGALGAVVLTDTAGLDDVGDLGRLRIERSLERLSWTDIAVLATPLNKPPEPIERDSLARLAASGRTLVIVGTFGDGPVDPAKSEWINSLGSGRSDSGPRLVTRVSGTSGAGIAELRNALADLGKPRNSASGDGEDAVGIDREPGPLEGLVRKDDLVVLVTPIDSAAPRGRLILPEAATLRDALDKGCVAIVVREHELASIWPMLAAKPRLVVTDSQVFAQVVANIPPDQPLSSFSILYARKKGELARFAGGIEFLLGLEPARAENATGSVLDAQLSVVKPTKAPLRLLAIEACTHNRTHEDIATRKIPAALARASGREIELTVTRELADNPPEVGRYDLAVTCGGCMATRRRMLSQLDALARAGLPVVNFGILLAWAGGAFPRALLAEGILRGDEGAKLQSLLYAQSAYAEADTPGSRIMLPIPL